MLDEEILELRRKLDESITNNSDYETIYKLSVELDKLIEKYYKERMENSKNSGEKNK